VLHAVGPHPSGVNSAKFAGLFGTAEQAAGKIQKTLLQGLKPIAGKGFTLGLKPQPPKEECRELPG